GFGLGLCCAGLGCRLVGKRFALPDLLGLFDGFLADFAALDAVVFGAFLARHPRECGDDQRCRDHDDDDPNDSAGSHLGSLDWLSMLIVEIGRIELWQLWTGNPRAATLTLSGPTRWVTPDRSVVVAAAADGVSHPSRDHQ